MSVTPLGGVPSVTDLCTIGPCTKSPTALMEDCSTVRVAVVPGVNPCSAAISAQSVGVGVPLTAVMTWATLSVVGGRRARRDPVDERAGVRRVHRVAEMGERGRRRVDWAWAIWR